MLIRITILSILLLSGCRTVQRAFSSADSKKTSYIDSSAVKTEQNKSKYQRETVTEYVYDTLWKTRTISVPDVHVVEVPKPYPYIVKQTVKESGENVQEKTEQVSQVKTEEVKTSEVEKDKSASFPVLLQWAALMFGAAFLLGAAALIIKQFK